jgi:hypothetical protein
MVTIPLLTKNVPYNKIDLKTLILIELAVMVAWFPKYRLANSSIISEVVVIVDCPL